MPFNRELPFLSDLAAWVLFLVIEYKKIEVTKWALVKEQQEERREIWEDSRKTEMQLGLAGSVHEWPSV